jgi:carboxypeptidase Taq
LTAADPRAAWPEFERRQHELVDLSHVAGLVGWDQQVCMPPKGAGQRAEQSSTLASLLHERLVDERFGETIATLLDADVLDEVQAASVREAARERDRAVRVPADLVRELARTESEGFETWRAARAARDFAMFRPLLERLVDLQQQRADAIGYAGGERYDALLDGFEPGMRVARLEPLLGAFRAELVPFAQRVLDAPAPDVSFLRRGYPEQQQWDFTVMLLRELGFDLEAGRQDRSAHPFTGGCGPFDVRLTTRFLEDDPRSSIMATLHEAGHGLYEQGIDEPRLLRTFAGSAASLGLHESQSRLWENIVGRSRAFWHRYYPALHEAFPTQLADVGEDRWWRAVNAVERSLIRVEADEVTYNLHVLLRFELELGLIRGELQVADLPEAWNDAMDRYVGIRPPHDGDGVLQDVHWSGGTFGYFPTYTLGTLYSAQLAEAARRDLGDLDAQVLEGDFAALLGWLREHVHRRGCLVPAEQIAMDATGQPLGHDALMRYLHAKYGELYAI